MTPAALALIVYSAQIMLVVAAATLAERLLRPASPRARLIYWRTVGATCLALPVLAIASPHPPSISMTFGEAAVAVIVDGRMPTAASSSGTILLWIWASGAAAGLARILGGVWRLRAIRRSSVAIAQLDGRLEALRAAIAPRAELRWSDAVNQPVTFGVRRPLVLLPPRVADLEPEAQHAIVCHELLHVRRRDWLWIVIEEHARVLAWFHPAVWWLIDRIRLSREQLVDELVIGRTPSRRCYMHALMTFADTPRSSSLSTAFLRRRHLHSRLRELAKGSHMSTRRLIWTTAVLAAALSGVTAGAANTLPLDLTSLALQDGARARVEIRLAETAPAAGLQEAVVSGSGQRIYMHPTTLATDTDITSAQAIETGPSQFGIGLTFGESASARLARETAAHIGKLMAIRIDGNVVSAPTLRAPIAGSGVITGDFTAQSAQALAARLAPLKPDGTAGDRITLPVPVHRERPYYTPEAMAARIEGTVLLETVVLADGSVGGVSVVRSLDSELGLDQRAIEALEQWTWKPGTRDGEPVRVAVTVEMTFTLK